MTTLTRLAYLTLVVGSAVPALAQPWLTPSPGVNFASGLICSYSPSPNYGLSTDAGDPFQLIDGIYNLHANRYRGGNIHPPGQRNDAHR